MAKHDPCICPPFVYHRACNTYYDLVIRYELRLVQQQQYEYTTTVYSRHCAQSIFAYRIFGTATTAETTAVVVVVVLTPTHRHNAVHGHRTGPSNYCCCILPLFSMHEIF